jgi:hypothetical protein
LGTMIQPTRVFFCATGTLASLRFGQTILDLEQLSLNLLQPVSRRHFLIDFAVRGMPTFPKPCRNTLPIEIAGYKCGRAVPRFAGWSSFRISPCCTLQVRDYWHARLDELRLHDGKQGQERGPMIPYLAAAIPDRPRRDDIF